MIKLIATDLDGTLLNIFHTTDNYILRTIDKVLDNDMVFVIATGRSMHEDQYERLFGNRKIYRIINNGSLIYNLEHDIIFEKTIDKETINEILSLFPNQAFSFISKNRTLVNAPEKDFIEALGTQQKLVERIFQKVTLEFLVGNEYDATHHQILDEEIIKINCRINDLDTRKRFKEYVNNNRKIVNKPFSEGMFEITHSDVNKANALKFLLKELNIEESQVATFGDGGNDIELLHEFENSYAPKGANLEARSAAKNTIGHNSNYAVPRKIRQLIRKNGR